MADRKPLKVLPDSASGTGGGDSTGIGEFLEADTLGVVDGGTGLGTVATSNILTGNGTSALSAESTLTFDGTTFAASASSGVGTISLEQTGDNGTSPEIKFVKNRGSGNAATGLSGALSFQGLDAANNTDTYAQIRGNMDDVTSGGEDGSLQFWTNVGGTLTERMRILSGGGITFNGDTAAANALDDYEEGTWTPVWKFGGTGGTANTQTDNVAWYTKIGNMVTVWYRGALANSPSGSGSLVITGLPYTIQNTTNQYPGTGAWSNLITFGGGIAADGNPNTTFVNVENLSSSTSTGVANTQHSDCVQYSQIRFILQYTV